MKPFAAWMFPWMGILCISGALAQTEMLIDIDRGRMSDGAKVYQRAVLSKPAGPSQTALLTFRGMPGISRLQSVEDRMRNFLPFLRQHQRLFHDQGIAIVVMDCPTDQWGSPGSPPTACLDDYRSSIAHADDVRSVMEVLRRDHGFTEIYVMGHSIGTLSSRWLARNLGNEIAGSIHSASINMDPQVFKRAAYGQSVWKIRYDFAAPALHVHNENDACRATPYSVVRAYAGPNLMTVRGGIPEGDPCGAGHLHSHQGREEVVAKAVIAWMKSRKIETPVGD